MKRILAIILTVILVLSSFTFAFATSGNGGGGFNIGIDGPFNITLEEGECKTVEVTISGSGSNNKEDGFIITYPTEIEIDGNNISVKDSDTYDFYDNSTSFSFDLKICALSGAESIEIDLFDGLDPSVPNQQSGTYIILGERVGLKGKGSSNLNVTVTEPTPENYTLTINYIDEDDNTVATKHTETLEDGSTYSVDSPDVDGYTPDQETVSGTITEDTTVTVTYTKEDSGDDTTTEPAVTYLVTLNASPTEGGNVSGAGDYEAGENVTVTATTNSGFTFEGWTEDTDTSVGNSNDMSFTFTMPEEDLELTANFEAASGDDSGDNTTTEPAVTYTVTLNTSPSGVGTVTGNGTYEENDTVTINAVKTGDYTFTGWELDGDVVSTEDTYNFSMPAQDLTYTAVFEEKEGDSGGGDNPNPPTTGPTSNPKLKIVKTAVDKEVYVGEEAKFIIVVTNTGNTDLEDVNIKDEMAGIDITIDLDEGESEILEASVTTTEVGKLTNIASAHGGGASNTQDSASVKVVALEIEDDDNPLGDPDTEKDPKDEPEKEDEKEEEVLIETNEEDIPKDTPDNEELEEEQPPLDLPDTGVLPVELFYGLGALVSGAGLLVSKKK